MDIETQTYLQNGRNTIQIDSKKTKGKCKKYRQACKEIENSNDTQIDITQTDRNTDRRK